MPPTHPEAATLVQALETCMPEQAPEIRKSVSLVGHSNPANSIKDEQHGSDTDAEIWPKLVTVSHRVKTRYSKHGRRRVTDFEHDLDLDEFVTITKGAAVPYYGFRIDRESIRIPVASKRFAEDLLARLVSSAFADREDSTKAAKRSRFIRALRLIEGAVTANPPCLACKDDYLSCMVSEEANGCLMCTGRQTQCSFKIRIADRTEAGEAAKKYGRVMFGIRAVADKLKQRNLKGAGDALVHILSPAIDDFAQFVGIGKQATLEQEATERYAKEVLNRRKLAKDILATADDVSWPGVEGDDDAAEEGYQSDASETSSPSHSKGKKKATVSGTRKRVQASAEPEKKAKRARK